MGVGIEVGVGGGKALLKRGRSGDIIVRED